MRTVIFYAIALISIAVHAATGDIKVQQRSAAGSFYDNIFATAANGVLITSSGGNVTASTTLPAVPVQGTNTNNNAATGFIGEYVTASVASASPVSLSSTVPANVTSISLTAGDWDVSGSVGFKPDPTTAIVFMLGGVSTTSATNPDEGNRVLVSFKGNASDFNIENAIPTVRVSIAATTTVYLVADAYFGASTMGAFGRISARRVR